MKDLQQKRSVKAEISTETRTKTTCQYPEFKIAIENYFALPSLTCQTPYCSLCAIWVVSFSVWFDQIFRSIFPGHCKRGEVSRYARIRRSDGGGCGDRTYIDMNYRTERGRGLGRRGAVRTIRRFIRDYK